MFTARQKHMPRGIVKQNKKKRKKKLSYSVGLGSKITGLSPQLKIGKRYN